MALPKWITPAGNLGIVPNLEYYQFTLDAYDESGGTLVYSRISGRLPLGIQLVNVTGAAAKLQGIPVSELGGDQNVEYRFTIRVKNSTTNEVADRTFTLTITNIAPPIITPRNVDLGIYLDGTIVNQQLEAIEFTPGASLTWRIKSGDVPPGLTLSATGLLYGYVQPLEQPGPGSDPNWDKTPWSMLGWDFTPQAINKTFNFVIEVFDGVNYDTSTYRIEVFPRSGLTADNNILTADTGRLSSGEGLSDIDGQKHYPIITTTQEDLIPIRQGSYFSFNVDAIDLDGDILQYTIPSSASGKFDEQILAGNSIPYVSATPINGNLFAGGNNLVDPTTPALFPTDIIKVFNTNKQWYDATVNYHTTVKIYGNVRIVAGVGNSVTQSFTSVTGNIVSISDTTGFLNLGNVITANVGDFITQGSANATVTANIVSSSNVAVVYTAGNFTSSTGNISINGTTANVFPTAVSCFTDVSTLYTGSDTFTLNRSAFTVNINSINTYSYPISVVSVGVALGGISTEGTVGFDEAKFDQGTLALPLLIPSTQLSQIDINTGWITGHVPAQTISEVQYQFEMVVYKRDYPSYSTSRLYTITVLGDLNDTIDWITPSNLGTIENGRVSDLYIVAESTKNKPIAYKLSANGSHRLPQGLQLQLNGLISGRVSFELFGLDDGTTTIDGGATTYDNTYTFTVTAGDYANTISEDRTFTLRVVNRNVRPYEDLYLKAMLSLEQRATFNELVNNRSIFPSELIYRNTDPFFGLAKELKTLFVPGVTASTLADYTLAAELNHFTKRVEFGDIKTAVALDTNFDVKYEVVYLEILDENTSATGSAPDNSINLSTIIDVPYYDADGNSYNIAYPNAFDNMRSAMVDSLGYANKGALPDWMTSKQPNGRVLGFTRGVVLAHTVPGASSKIAYRLKDRNFNFNQLDFTVDRYQVDNSYSQNFNIATQSFITASETTFDRYPSVSSVFTDSGYVNYALTVSYESINNRLVSEIVDLWGGLDGNKNFRDGDLVVFAQQEFYRNSTIGEYNLGWSDVLTTWDDTGWDYDSNLTDNPYTSSVAWTAYTIFFAGYTVINGGIPYRVNTRFTSGAAFSIDSVYLGIYDDSAAGFDGEGFEAETAVDNLTAIPVSTEINLTESLGWDAAGYVPGYNENLLDPSIINKRVGVWRVNISDNDVVTLTFEKSIIYNNTLFVKAGFTYGGTTIYYDPVVKAGNLLPNYSIIRQQIRTTYTTFDGNGTRFFSNRDSYTVPGSEDKYIKFTKLGVFN